jgi:hypothetical protein
MSALRNTSLFAAVAAMTMWALVQSPSAQTSNDSAAVAKSAMEELSRHEGAPPPKASAAAAHQKAEADMMKALSSPPTEADKKAAAAMSK